LKYKIGYIQKSLRVNQSSSHPIFV